MRLIRCNRCGLEDETETPMPNPLFGFTVGKRVPNWTLLTVENDKGSTDRLDLCEDCKEVLLLQFMAGAGVAPITQPEATAKFPHQPMTDCQLVWNPGKGGFLCYHDDPELYRALIIDNAQNVAEGVPPEKVDDVLQRKVVQMMDDLNTAAMYGAGVKRCTDACSEGHTYTEGCLLKREAEDEQDAAEIASARAAARRQREYRLTLPEQRDDNGEDDEKNVERGCE